LDRAIFRQVLADLLTAGQCAREGFWWHLPSHRIVLSDADEELWCRLAPLFRAQPFQPPRVRDVARGESLPEDAVRKLLMQLTRTGRLYQVAHDHCFDRGAVADLAAIVRELARGHPTGAVAAAAFRDRIGTGRKLAIQILEFFDRTGLTRRLNDEHRLRHEDLEY
jgi:selenocysteine-specific elongation factor